LNPIVGPWPDMAKGKRVLDPQNKCPGIFIEFKIGKMKVAECQEYSSE
jgi:hypothetical protein